MVVIALCRGNCCFFANDWVGELAEVALRFKCYCCGKCDVRTNGFQTGPRHSACCTKWRDALVLALPAAPAPAPAPRPPPGLPPLILAACIKGKVVEIVEERDARRRRVEVTTVTVTEEVTPLLASSSSAGGGGCDR